MKSFVLLILLAAPEAVSASDWATFGGDPQRTGLVREESELTKSSIQKLTLHWKLKLDTKSKELTGPTVPVVHGTVGTPTGFKELAIVAGADDKVFAIDVDTGKLFWSKTLDVATRPKGQPGWLCPFALNATPVIDRRSRTVYVLASDGKLYSLNLVNGKDTAPPRAFTPEFGKPWSLNLMGDFLYTPVSQGCNGVKSAVYALNLKDPSSPAKVFSLTTTGGAGVWGRAGLAAGFDGRLYGATGDGPFDPEAGKYADTIFALSPEKLDLTDYYTPQNRAWMTKKDLDMGCMSPVIFKYQDWELLAGAGKEGVIYLLDTKSLGGADHRSPLFRSGLIANEIVQFAGSGFWGSFATYEDAAKERWLYAPAWGPQTTQSPRFEKTHGEDKKGSIMAFQVIAAKGKPDLKPIWRSRNLNTPESPLIVNGMVVALESGDAVEQVDENGKLLTSGQRIEMSRKTAAIYVFDAATGDELWNSGKTLESFTHFGGLAINNGRIYVSTADGTVYAFGLPQ